MSIRIAIANKLKFKVKGTFTDDAGKDLPFDFTLTARRLDTDQIAEKTALGSDATNSVREFVKDVVEDWSGVNDATGQPLPFTTDGLDDLLRLPGVALLVFRAYLENNGAKEKN